jgi:hypothetical protein
MDNDDLGQSCKVPGTGQKRRSNKDEVAANKIARQEAFRQQVDQVLHTKATKFVEAVPPTFQGCGGTFQDTPNMGEATSGASANTPAQAWEPVMLHDADNDAGTSDLNSMCRAMHDGFGQQGLPLIVRRHAQAALRGAKFAVPGMKTKPVPATVSAALKKTTLDLNVFHMPGVGIARGEHDETVCHVWFCDCSAQNISIERSAESLHMYAGGCSSLSDAECDHVKYCQYALSKCGITDITAYIEDTMPFEDNEDNNTG